MLTCLVLLLASCGGSATSAASNGAVPEQSTVVESRQYVIPKDRLNETLGRASPQERQFLEDGVVTFPEYEKATFDSIKCFTDRGFTIYPGDDLGPQVDGPRLTTRGTYSWSPASPPGYNVTRLSADIAACKTPYDTINFLWASITSPSAQEVQQARVELARCLRSLGYDAPDDASGLDVMKIAFPPDGHPHNGEPTPDFYLRCAHQAAVTYDIPGFMG
jgi:hypothetical protein